MQRRTIQSLLTACVCACFMSLPGASTAAEQTAGKLVQPSPAPVKPVTTDYYGTKVVDPYRYMENLKNPKVQTWMKAQNNYTRAVLARIPGRERLLAQLRKFDRSVFTFSVTPLPGDRYVILMLLPIASEVAKPTPAAPDFHPPKGTLVVLPFKNLSGDPKQQSFSDDFTEELTDVLGYNPALRVIAWDTASRYENTSESASNIGRALNVANILHGSIDREDDRVRISVELVNAVTGHELWSQHYDDSFAHVFKVEVQASKAIAQALRVKFSDLDLPTGGTKNPEAHELVLKGGALMGKPDAASYEAARKDFEQALALDPEYADAHALLAGVQLVLSYYSGLPLKGALPAIRARVQKALALDPHNLHAILVLGDMAAMVNPPNFAKARTEYRKALALDPSNSVAHMDYGTVLPLKPAVEETQEAIRLDPDGFGAWINLAGEAQDLGDWAQEVTAAETLLRFAPKYVGSAFYLAFAYQQLHENGKMMPAFDRVQPTTDFDKQQVAAGKLVYQALGNSTLRPQALAALKNLSRHPPNPLVSDNLVQMFLALGETAPALQVLENYCPAYPAGCNDLAINPVYWALRTDPRFERLAKKYTTVTLE